MSDQWNGLILVPKNIDTGGSIGKLAYQYDRPKLPSLNERNLET